MSLDIVEQKLIDCLKLWESYQTVDEGIDLFQKISFFYGRLDQQSKWEEFIQSEVQLGIGLMAEEYELKIGIGLFTIGLAYPNLSEKQLEQLEVLYKDGNYFNLMDYLLFDKNLLARKLDKYDIENRKIYNHEFSQELVDIVFKTFMNQGEDPMSNGGSIKVYDRPSNSVIHILDSRLTDFKTQKIIDFSHVFENDRFIEIVSQLFSSEIASDFLSWYSDKNGVHLTKDIGFCVANHDTFSGFEDFLKQNFAYNISIADKYLNFQRNVSTQWLEYANISK